MATYLTPGVYVEEISTLPPSVVGVSTAVPAFIGYTKIGPTADSNGAVEPVVARISTLLDYREQFGAANPSSFKASTGPASQTAVSELDTVLRTPPSYEFLLYYSLSLYFQNGGGSCYVVSIGTYSATPSKAHFTAGLAALEKEDEPTLILLTDAVNLGVDDYYTLCNAALAQCKKLGDRFAILDVKSGPTAVQDFRDKIGINNLSYGAAYYPYLQTTLNYEYSEPLVAIRPTAAVISSWLKAFDPKGISVSYTGTAAGTPRVTITATTAPGVTFNISPANVLTINAGSDQAGSAIIDAWKTTAPKQGFDIAQADDGSTKVSAIATTGTDLEKQPSDDQHQPAVTLDSVKATNTALYNQVKTAIALQRVVLPPSSAVAGIYASVDRDRGVWKAPANVSVAAVIGPVSKITNEEQDGLNVDPTAGKSINALRAFTGKGTLVWGARTLAGNDNEWRYIPVRRLFILIEESVQKASAFAVFEPNDATTWLKVKAMIESYLYGLWEQGALAGPTPAAAYFVQVGLGKTMTTDDVLNGRMIVEIGVAAVRPAEFIILRFTHKMQEA